jgi:hypothetical protein
MKDEKDNEGGTSGEAEETTRTGAVSKDSNGPTEAENQTPAKSGRTMADFLSSLFGEWEGIKKVSVLLGVVCFLFFYLGPTLFPRDIEQYSVKLGANNEIKLVSSQSWPSRKPTTHFYLVSAANPWLKTNIRVEKGDRLTVRSVSGGVNIAAHRLWEAADWDHRPPQPWEFLSRDRGKSYPRGLETERSSHVLHTGATYGALLMYVCPDPPDDCPCVDSTKTLRPPQARIEIIDDRGLVNHRVNWSGTLYFAVNDIVVDKREVYVGSDESYRKTAAEIDSTCKWDPLYRRIQETKFGRKWDSDRGYLSGQIPLWQQIMSRDSILWERVVKDYPEIWYDDNVGLYAVFVEVR